MFESMTVQVRAGLGERRLTAAVRSVLDRHHELSESCSVRRVSTLGLVGQALVDRTNAEVADAANGPGSPVFRVLWLDAGPDRSGRLVLLLHRHAVTAVPWHVLLSELVSAWNKGSLAGVCDR